MATTDAAFPSLTIVDGAAGIRCTCKAKAQLPSTGEFMEAFKRFCEEHAGCDPLPEYAERSSLFDSASEVPNDVEFQVVGIECAVSEIFEAHEMAVF